MKEKGHFSLILLDSEGCFRCRDVEGGEKTTKRKLIKGGEH